MGQRYLGPHLTRRPKAGWGGSPPTPSPTASSPGTRGPGSTGSDTHDALAEVAQGMLSSVPASPKEEGECPAAARPSRHAVLSKSSVGVFQLGVRNHKRDFRGTDL